MTPSRSTSTVLVTLLVTALGAAVVGVAPAAVTPGRTLTEAAPVVALGATHRHVAWATQADAGRCTVRMWIPWRKDLYTYKPGLDCREETSTGTGIAAVALASKRVLWLAYTGGNTREWLLFTATPTRRQPKQLRFESADVDGPAPIVLGQGTSAGVPYAVGRELVYLGENGSAIFKRTLAAPIRSVTAGDGPGNVVVAALLADGQVVALTASGTQVFAAPVAADVTSVALLVRGVVVQSGTTVRMLRAAAEETLVLPDGAKVVDTGKGRLITSTGGTLSAVHPVTGASLVIGEGTADSPVLGNVEAFGTAWARGKTLNWRSGPLPSS